jgi:hypothetical protein
MKRSNKFDQQIFIYKILFLYHRNAGCRIVEPENRTEANQNMNYNGPIKLWAIKLLIKI